MELKINSECNGRVSSIVPVAKYLVWTEIWSERARQQTKVNSSHGDVNGKI